MPLPQSSISPTHPNAGGIYVHIPYCKQACTYCDFYFSTSAKSMALFGGALVQEVQRNSGFFAAGTVIQSLYFGGGTPSLLPLADLEAALRALHTCYPVHPLAEITLEANPDDLTGAVGYERLKAWQALGINRLSVGIQSFDDHELRFMGRAHDATQARAALHNIHKAGYTNFSIDLIYATPKLSDALWRATLAEAIGSGAPQISAYALTVEGRTKLAHDVAKGWVTPAADDAFARQYDLLVDTLGQAGYEHYEVSNFAFQHYRAVHNSSYWQGLPYLGLGPSAHSYSLNPPQRHRNVANVWQYIEALHTGATAVCETETLSPTTQANELLLTRLRTTEGLPLGLLTPLVGGMDAQRYAMIEHWVAQGWVYPITATAVLRLTPTGKRYADGIAGALFYEAKSNPPQ